MSEFMDRARAEAEREVARRREALWENGGEHLNHSWGRGFEAGFMEGAAWAKEYEPADEEVEAACRAFYESTNPTMHPSMWLSWDRLTAAHPDVAENYRQAIMPALLAAQKVRAGQ